MSDYYESRQHLNLSQLAFDTIENDKYIFQDKPSLARMLNWVFAVYHDYADASIENACIRYKEQIERFVKTVPSSAAKEDTVSALIDSYKLELIETANSYPREHQFKFQLDRQNFIYIMDWRDTEDAYEGVPGRFIKAVLEEYARKPLVEREAILFNDLIEMVGSCVKSHLSLVLTLANGARYEVRPFGVLTDKGNNYHYLVGYSRKAGEKADDKQSSFRISNIREYKLYHGRSGKLTEKERRSIAHRINSVGVQFLLEEPDRIKVRLSKRGKSMYESQAHLRPVFISREMEESGDWVYEFNCTKIQAQYFFFKFGAEAEILYPLDLRNLFAKRYQEACNQYS